MPEQGARHMVPTKITVATGWGGMEHWHSITHPVPPRDGVHKTDSGMVWLAIIPPLHQIWYPIADLQLCGIPSIHMDFKPSALVLGSKLGYVGGLSCFYKYPTLL